MPHDPATPEYEFLLRDPRSFAFRDELPPQHVLGRWTRQEIDAGSFQLTIAREHVTAADVAPPALLEIRRGGVRELVGMIERRHLDALGRTWTLAGRDLKGFWLSKRIVGATAASAKSGAAETVLKAYVDEQIGPGASDADRRAGGELNPGKTWTVEQDNGIGATVSWRALRGNLLRDVLAPICRLGGVIHDVVLTGADPLTGYEYIVRRPTDATVGSGGTPFSVSWDTVARLVYSEDYQRTANYLYVLGDGAGGSRNVTEVSDADAIAARFRAEGAYDARYATTAAQRTDLGTMELARQQQGAVSVEARPFRSGENVYREDWDVGWDVTIDVPEIGVQVDRRIVAATVTLGVEGEEIGFALGQYGLESALRRLSEELRQLRVAANE